MDGRQILYKPQRRFEMSDNSIKEPDLKGYIGRVGIELYSVVGKKYN